MLLATLSSETQALLTVVATMFGGAATWVVTRLWDWKKEQRREKLEDTDRTVARLEKLAERLDRERVELREDNRKLEHRIDQLNDKVKDAEVKAERAVAWVRHLEAALEREKIPFVRWSETGSNIHPALPEGDAP